MMRTALFLLAFLILAPFALSQNKVNAFPQVADGVLSDGTYYKSTFMILPGFESASTITCSLVLNGLGVNLDNKGASSRWTITIAQGSYYSSATAADQPLRTGYALLTCSDYVFAQALYSYYGRDGSKIAEATVFGSEADFGGSFRYRMIADQRGSQLGIAIANDTDLPRTYQLTINSLSGTVTVPARASVAKFLTEVLPSSANTVGVLKVQASDLSSFYAIGLRFTGGEFTTIPAN
jgi:hypothetical protein